MKTKTEVVYYWNDEEIKNKTEEINEENVYGERLYNLKNECREYGI